jgi:cytochrome P450
LLIRGEIVWHPGFRLSTASTVVRSIFRDPSDYPEPATFNPHRFEEDAHAKNDTLDPRKLAFGLGRR